MNLIQEAWLENYKKVLKRFFIDPTDTHNSSGEDAGEYLSGEVELSRYCLIGQANITTGVIHYTYPNYDNLDDAQGAAWGNINDDIFCESPYCVIDLETLAEYRPRWELVQWKEVAHEYEV